jgi:hypothetical protein
MILDAYDNGWLSMDIEEKNGIAWVHMNISEWNKKTAKKLPEAIQGCIEVLKDYEYKECYIAALKSDSTLRKFLVMTGCQPHVDLSTASPPLEVWKRKL